jgi:sodium transport system permease protein
MKWNNVRLVFLREVRDQLRDRRTLFTIAVLPLLLYPLLGMIFLQIAQFMREHPTSILVLGAEALPEQPALLQGAAFAEQFVMPRDQGRLRLTIQPLDDAGSPSADARQRAQRVVQAGEFDAVVVFPADFAERLAEFHERPRDEHGAPRNADAADVIPQPEVFVNTASDKSRIAADRVERVLELWREAIVSDNLRQRNVPLAATQPFQVVNTDVAQERSRRAAAWSKILPFIVLVWALTGAFYPAIDLCAGEKERGTLETLLCSPAQRSEIVWGKLFTIMVFSMATSVFNLLCMALTSVFILGRIAHLDATAAPAAIGMPPWSAVVWLLLALAPIAALFSALALAIAAFARSSKEGQYYLMPLLLVTLPLMMLPLLPTAELDLGMSLIPVTGVMLLLRALIEGQYVEALRYAVPVIAVTAVCCLVAIRWAVEQFNNESVLFRESERWGLSLWLRHVIRDRHETPTISEAVLCGLLILMVRFFASFAVSMPDSWPRFVTVTVVSLISFVATPALLMAVVLTRSPAKTLLLQRPRWVTLPMAIALAIVIHPAGVTLSEVIRSLYPISPDVVQQLHAVESLLGRAPSLWSLLIVLALVPAICEELAFRGFILSGLRHSGHKWGAIVASSVFFGATHGILQQSLSAFALGLVLGYLAVQTRSLLPGLAFHAVYNALVLALAWNADGVHHWSGWDWLLTGTGETAGYRWPVVAMSILSTVGILVWFRGLPFQPTAEESLHEAVVRGERLAETPEM